ncbi:MAG: SDR family oxidoreductase [Planctomycetaceae bacterium]|nr:SDR family oxidoreductase [Planctomycetaceae bacterium]
MSELFHDEVAEGTDDEPYERLHILIVGYGYLGHRIADLEQNGHRITALTRSPEKGASIKDQGHTPIVGDVLDPATLAALPAADVMLIALAHDAGSGVPKRTLLVDGVTNLVRAMHTRVRHIVYISSTSVYGQSDGAWIDEDSATEPTTEGGRLTLEAEQNLQEICNAPASSCRLTILRLAGIYGPGRLIGRVDQLRAGTPVAGSPDAWLNLIHVDDADALVCKVVEGRETSQVILICDDRPVTRGEFYSALAREIGAPTTTFDPDSAVGRRTTGLNKRCRNARLHAELFDPQALQRLYHPDSIAAIPQLIYFERAEHRI